MPRQRSSRCSSEMTAIRYSEAEFDKLTERLLRFSKATVAQAQEIKRNPPPAPAKRIGSKIEELLAEQIAAAALPVPVREFKHVHGRRFRLDFAWPDRMIGVEVQGMVHRIKKRFEADIEKRALGLLAGWRIMEVSGASIRSGQAVKWIGEMLA